jgi:hypothetical protein
MVKFASMDDDSFKKISGHIFLMAEAASQKIAANWEAESRLKVGTLP